MKLYLIIITILVIIVVYLIYKSHKVTSHLLYYSNNSQKVNYICTAELANSCNQYPVWLGKRNMMQLFNISNKPNATIYVNSFNLDYFINNIHDKLENNYILVSGGDDHTIPYDIKNYKKILSSNKCIKWFSQNCISIHPKLECIPIGLDYHTMSYTEKSRISNKTAISPTKQEQELIEIKNKFMDLRKTKLKAVANFQYNNMNTFLGNKSRNNRKQAYNALKNKDVVVWLPKQSRKNFWKECDKYAFVVSPFGNGIDCHRTWEALVLGRIPIIFKHKINTIFEDLPVVIVDDWNKISRTFLEKEFDKIIKNWDTYNFDKLTLKYWARKINQEV